MLGNTTQAQMLSSNMNALVADNPYTCPCLNESLPWDGSSLGTYPLLNHWSWRVGDRTYHGLHLPQGVIFCFMKQYEDAFPLLVHQLVCMCRLTPRGIHTIYLAKSKYLLYYVPVRHGRLIYETSLHTLAVSHPLRQHPAMIEATQHLLVLCDVLGLYNSNEGHILIRDDVVPVLSNDRCTYLLDPLSADKHVLGKTVFERWFGEKYPIEHAARTLLIQATGEHHLPRALHLLRDGIEQLIRRCDTAYIWYAQCIVDRWAGYILKHDDFSFAQ